jgi:hypothetical protein
MQTEKRLWQILSALFAGLAVLAAYHIFFLERDIKSVQVVLLANSSVVGIEESVSADIDLLYRDKPIDNFSFVQVKVENDGNQTVREEDFVKPISLVFPSEAEIVDGDVVESSPRNIGVTVGWQGNIATLGPVMLNAGDRAIVKLFLINMPQGSDTDDIVLDARIAGVGDCRLVNAIEEKGQAERGRGLATLSLEVALMLLSVGFILGTMTVVRMYSRHLRP